MISQKRSVKANMKSEVIIEELLKLETTTTTSERQTQCMEEAQAGIHHHKPRHRQKRCADNDEDISFDQAKKDNDADDSASKGQGSRQSKRRKVAKGKRATADATPGMYLIEEIGPFSS